jgi:hypothetical protein
MTIGNTWEIEMSERDLTPGEKEDLERLIDKVGIEAVLMAVSEICGEKAEHIRATWQDNALGRRWDVLCGAVGVTVHKALGL